MKNFLSCIQKDIKLFCRSKVSAVIAILVPLLIVILITTAFNSEKLEGVRVGVYSPSYSSLTNSIIQNFENNSYYVSKEDNKDFCLESVKNGDNHICIVFPADLSRNGNTDALSFHVDNSRLNLAYILIDEVKTEIGTTSTEISLDLANDLIARVNEAKASLTKEKDSFSKVNSDISTISSNAVKIADSLPDTKELVEILNKAKANVNALSENSSNVNDLNKNIDKAIKEINSLNESVASVTSNIGSLEDSSSSAKEKVESISANLDNIIKDLNAVKASNAENVVSPIKTEIKSVVDETKNWNFIFPTLLALMVMFGGTILASVMASREKRTRAYFRNFITPTSDFTFLMSMYVSSLIILIVQFTIIFTGLALFTHLDILPFLGPTALVLFITASAFIFLGLCVGHFIKSEEVAILISLSLVSLMMFFSNTIFPIESILGKYQQFVLYNPFVIASTLLKRAILFEATIPAMLQSLLIMAAIMAIFLTFAIIARKTMKKLA